MPGNLREKKIDALKRMLNLNTAIQKGGSNEPQWKILVYDRLGQDIISPILSVKELRELGVTLHLLLDTDREAIPDVPAIYFIYPTDDNVKRICMDMKNNLYEMYYFNFITPISRHRLEDLAQGAIAADSVQSISKLFDQYTDFISLENDLFVLRHQNSDAISYEAMNSSDTKDADVEQIISTIVDCLFSVFVTMGVVPIIRCPRGNAAEMVAEKLDKKLRDNLRDTRNSLFTGDIQAGQFSFQRPLLVILDRNMDLATPFHHTWTYQALAHDVLSLRLNRVEVEESPGGGGAGPRPGVKARKKTFDLSAGDAFWQEQKGSPFPEVAEAVQVKLEEYRSREEEVKRLKAAMGLDAGDETALSLISDNTSRLTSAVSSLPELMEQKRLLDQHTSIATALLDQIKARKLDTFFEIEEKLLSRQSQQQLEKQLMDLLNDPESGTPEDKLRLFIIAFLCGPPMSDAEVDQYCTALQNAGCDISAVKYVKRFKFYSKMDQLSVQGGGTQTKGMFTKLMSQGSTFLMEGVKNLVIKRHNLPFTRVVDALMECKTSAEVDDYRYFDPKLHRYDDSSVPRSKQPFSEAFVFVVGGGNYIEYQNMVDYCKAKTGTAKRVHYGCTQLLNASQFLAQLEHLGASL